MTPAEVITEIVHLGGKIWTEGDRLKFRDVPARLVPAIRDHKAALLALLKNETGVDATIAPTMQPEPTMAPQSAPATVSCGQCVRFQPGTTKMGIGTCLATVTGQPPAGRSGTIEQLSRWLRVAVLNMQDQRHDPAYPRIAQTVPRYPDQPYTRRAACASWPCRMPAPSFVNR